MRAIHHGDAALGAKFELAWGVPTRGPFGGEIEERDGATLERAPAAIVEALRAADRAAFEPPAIDAALRASFITFDADGDGRVRYASALPPSIASTITASRRADALDALARATRLVSLLHGSSRAHGELGLGAEAIRVAADGAVSVLTPASGPAPGMLLAARIRSGAPLDAVAFSAPEVVTGHASRAPADVYALAAIAHELLSGRPPLGQIDFTDAQRGPFAELARTIARALSANEWSRPDAATLATALASATTEARRLEEDTTASPYREAEDASAERPPPARAPRPTVADRKEQASSMSSILVMLLGVGGLFVFTGAIWLVSVTWAALAGSGRFVLLLALTGGVLGGSLAVKKRGYTGSAEALRVLGLELFWADGAYLLDVTKSLDDAGAWSALAAVMTALAFVAAGALGSAIFAVLATLHLVVAATAFGIYVHSGSPTGPAIYPLAVGLVGAAIAFGGHRWRARTLGVPFAVLAVASAFVSAIVALWLSSEPRQELFGSAWPYVVAALLALASFLPEKAYAMLGAFTCGAVLAIVPSTEALLHGESVGYLLAAVALGFVIVWASFLSGRLGRDTASQTSWVAVGLTSAVAAPSLFFAERGWGTSGLEALTGRAAVNLWLVVGVSIGLLVTSYLVGKRAKDKVVYRLVELAALAQIFGTFTLQSLADRADVFYPLSILCLGGACLAVGALTRHATLVLLASLTLLLNLAIQYFAKLWDVFPTSLLVLVFGLGLLAGGVLYERRLKHLLPTLREWA